MQYGPKLMLFNQTSDYARLNTFDCILPITQEKTFQQRLRFKQITASVLNPAGVKVATMPAA